MSHAAGRDPTNWYGLLLVKHACLIMIATIVVVGAASIVVFGVYTPELDTQNSFSVFGDDISNSKDAISLARDKTAFTTTAVEADTDQVYPQQTLPVNFLRMTYYDVDGPDGNLLTEERLTAIRDYERSFEDLKDWDKFCLWSFTSPGACSFTGLDSLTNVLFASDDNGTTIPDGQGPLVDDPEAFVRALDIETLTSTVSNNFLDGGDAYVMLGGFNFGYPLEGYDKPLDPDQQEEMNEKFNAFAVNMYTKLVADNEPEAVAARGFEVYYIGVGVAEGVTNLEFFSIVIADGLKALGSVTFVLLYMVFHTRTWTLSCLGMLHILASLPLALFVNRVIIGIQFINFLQFLSVYIILGIGADDVFIMLDAWKQSALEAPEVTGSVAARMSWAVTRAAKAMAISSATTAAAFYVNGFSSIPSVAFFGIFTGSLVVSNYILVITWFPAAIVMKERVNRYGCFSLCRARTTAKSSVAPDPASVENAPVKKEHDVSELELRRLEKYFRDTFTPFMYNNRLVILASFSVLIIASIIGALQIEPANDPGRFLPDDANLQRFVDSTTEAFPTAIPSTEALILWGVTGIDREGVDPTDLSFLGNEQYYDDFNPGTLAAQDFLADACQALKEEETWVRFTESGTSDNITRTPEVGCFIEDLYSYLNESLSYRIPEADFYDTVVNYTSDRGAEWATIDQPNGDSRPTSWLGFDKTTKEIIWVAMVANISLENPFAPAATIRPFFDRVEAFREELNANVADDVGPALQTAGDTWVGMATEEVLLTVAFSGAVISLVATFLVMLISTRVVAISVFVVITVGAVFLALVTAMVIFGWSIGVIESISLTVTVGLAVDYVVHLANSYNESLLPTRFLRLQQGLTEMGISVFSSAITTLGAALVLLTTSLVFFSRFGSFIAMVITISFLYAFGFFVALAAVAGPKTTDLFASILPLDFSGNEHQFPEQAGASGIIFWNGSDGSVYDPKKGTVTSADGKEVAVDRYEASPRGNEEKA